MDEARLHIVVKHLVKLLAALFHSQLMNWSGDDRSTFSSSVNLPAEFAFNS